jgi:hypothetical protein
MKTKATQPTFRVREAEPKVTKDAKIMCPFCPIPHPLIAGEVAPCGTYIHVSAVQRIYRAKFNKDMVCAKCGKVGGEMIHSRNAFTHLEDCMPGVAVMNEAPKFSRFASFVYKMNDGILKTLIEKRTGEAKPVEEVEPSGKRTGVTLGYFFYVKSK